MEFSIPWNVIFLSISTPQAIIMMYIINMVIVFITFTHCLFVFLKQW